MEPSGQPQCHTGYNTARRATNVSTLKPQHTHHSSLYSARAFAADQLYHTFQFHQRQPSIHLLHHRVQRQRALFHSRWGNRLHRPDKPYCRLRLLLHRFLSQPLCHPVHGRLGGRKFLEPSYRALRPQRNRPPYRRPAAHSAGRRVRLRAAGQLGSA